VDVDKMKKKNQLHPTLWDEEWNHYIQYQPQVSPSSALGAGLGCKLLPSFLAQLALARAAGPWGFSEGPQATSGFGLLSYKTSAMKTAFTRETHAHCRFQPRAISAFTPVG
jgi:hypothetical protein